MTGVQSNGSESASARGANRSKSPRGGSKRDRLNIKQKQTNHLDLVFKAISERPQLDRLTREERIREKLRFFNLE